MRRGPRALALGAVLLLVAVSRLWGIDTRGFGAPYYAAAAFSMAQDWRLFFFAAFDPAGFLAVDKPPLALWAQALSVRLLGLSALALHLPQALAGVVTAALLHGMVAARHGAVAGLLAALFYAVSPINLAVERANTTDAMLVLTQVLAAWPLLLAAERGRLGPLLLSAVVLGLAFWAKMAAALLVLPGFVALYLLTAPLGCWRRIRHLLAAAGVLAVVALGWPLAVDATPPDRRPYVDSTIGNREMELVLGHNALDRFVRPGWLRPREAAAPAARAPTPSLSTPPLSTEARAAPPGPLRLATPWLGSQALWLLVPALLGLFLVRSWPARLLWGGWLLVPSAVFSVMGGIFLSYYLAVLGPPLAVLAALGIVHLPGRWPGLAALAAAGAWQAWLWGAPDSLAAVAGALLLVAGVLLFTRWRPAALGLGVGALLAGPGAYAAGTIVARGNPTYPAARLGPAAEPVQGDGLPNRTRLQGFLERNRGGARYLLAATSIQEAATLILRGGGPVMAMGGFNGVTPAIGVEEFARHVALGDVRFALLGGRALADPASPLLPVLDWVRARGRPVAPERWRPAAPPQSPARPRGLAGSVLYDLRPE